MASANGVEITGVSKRFLLNTEPIGRTASWFFHGLISRVRRRELWALQDVTFNIPRGDLVGILGVNGSGKSTLLRLICGISDPTSGEIRRLPRVAPLLDLTAGFHPALSGYENVFLNGSIIGLHREEVRALLPDIVSFSGLDHKFLEAPVRTYSTGMMARLGFALAVAVDPDIILIDEVLAVGDLEFQARSAHKLLEFRDAGKAMALVSHASAAIGELSTEAVWLHEGRIRSAGQALVVVGEYNAYLTERVHRREIEFETGAGNGHGPATVPSVLFQKMDINDGAGRAAREFETNSVLIIELEMSANTETDPPDGPIDLRIDVMFQTGIIVDEFLASERGFHPVQLDRCGKPVKVSIRFDPLLLLRGDYSVVVAAVYTTGDHIEVIGRSERLQFQVTSDYLNFGVYPAFVPVEFS